MISSHRVFRIFAFPPDIFRQHETVFTGDYRHLAAHQRRSVASQLIPSTARMRLTQSIINPLTWPLR
jgi:hypothetical protein